MYTKLCKRFAPLAASLTAAFLLFCSVLCAAACADAVAFSTVPLSDPQRSEVAVRLDVRVLKTEPARRALVGFAVRGDGALALGSGDSDSKTISVYDPDGGFLYALRLTETGSYGIRWAGETLMVCLVRANMLISLDAEGRLLDAQEILGTQDNLRAIEAACSVTKLQLGDTSYELQNPKGSALWSLGSYSQLVITDGTGQTRLFYDISGSQRAKWIAICVGAGLLASACMLAAAELRGRKRARRRRTKP